MAPDLVQIHREFSSDDVVFIGLTSDGESTARDYCARHAMDWAFGWGAEEFLDGWLQEGYPATFIIGRDGRICWNDGAARKAHRTETLREIIEREIRRAL